MAKEKKKLLDLAKSLAKRHGSGFKRTQKQWENSLADHIGNFGDRLTFDDLIAIAVGGWAALHTQHPIHFLSGVLGYKLARTDGIPSELTGIAILAAVGLIGVPSGAEFKLFPTEAKPLFQTGPYYIRAATVG